MPEKANHQQTTANHQGCSQTPSQRDSSSQEQLIIGAGNGKELITNQNYSQTDNGNIISIDEGIKEIHGEWLLVTRKKKEQQ